MTDWAPEKYLAFADERTRPARDLLAQVPLMDPLRVYDLGCGPGNSTRLLVERYPLARVAGVDNSPAMLEAARTSCPGADFISGDLAQWTPPDAPELMFSNAAFQWIPDHLSVLERLCGALAPGGMLAVQMPDNLMEPSHALMRKAAGQGRWAAKLLAAEAARDALPSVAEYYRRLKPLLRHLDIWHTIYNHPLDGVDGIVAWLSTTGLRPFLAPLDEGEREDFLAQYRALLREAYPQQADHKVLLRFPRLFLVGMR